MTDRNIFSLSFTTHPVHLQRIWSMTFKKNVFLKVVFCVHKYGFCGYKLIFCEHILVVEHIEYIKILICFHKILIFTDKILICALKMLIFPHEMLVCRYKMLIFLLKILICDSLYT